MRRSAELTRVKLVIVGTGRCGTGFFSRLLTEVNAHCGHEQIFGPIGPEPTQWRRDSSWLAVPYLHELDCPIVGIWRDPLDTISSIVGVELFRGQNIYLDFIKTHWPERPRGLAEKDLAAEFYCEWNLRILEAEPDLVIRSEDPDLASLAKIADVDPDDLTNAAKVVPRDVNRRTHTNIKACDLDPLRSRRLVEVAERLEASTTHP